MSVEINEIAAPVARRIAQTLQAQVWVLDEWGEVVGRSAAPARLPSAPDQLHVPIRGHGWAGEVIMGAVGEAASPTVLKTVVEMIVSQVLTTAHSQSQQALKATFVHDLIHGRLQDEGDILRQGQILGMDLSRPRAVILIEAADYILSAVRVRHIQGREIQIRRRAQDIIDAVVRFFALPSDAICAHIGQGEVVVLKASGTRDLAAWAGIDDPPRPAASWADLDALKRAASALLERLREDTGRTLSLGIGRYHPGVLGMARSYEDARAALSLGCRFEGPNRVYCLDGLGIAAFVGLGQETTKLSLANHLLSPLDHEPELIDTLRTFFELDCSTSRVAQALSIHRNTLTYRLDKVASLTGLNPRRFDHAVQIRLAFLLQALHDVRSESDVPSSAGRTAGENAAPDLRFTSPKGESGLIPAIGEIGRSRAGAVRA